MQFSAAIALVALVASPAAALWDSAGCSGIGACTVPNGCNYFSYTIGLSDPEWDCGSAGTITSQISSSAKHKFEQGLATGQVVPRADFPRCDLVQPSDTATLLKTTFNDITVYGWVEYNCVEKQRLEGCYHGDKNPSASYVCKVYKAGQVCSNIPKTVVRQSDCPK